MYLMVSIEYSEIDAFLLIPNDCISSIVVNDSRNELGMTYLYILFHIAVEEYVADNQASQASVSIAEAPEYIPSVLGTSQHIPSQG